MADFMLKVENLIGSMNASRVQNSVKGYGHCTVRYSQCAEPVRSYILKDPLTKIGICVGSSAYWIRDHANESSLFASLLNRSGTVNMGVLRLVAEVQANGMRTGVDQDAYTEDWLVRNKIVRLLGSQFIPRNFVGSGPATFDFKGSGERAKKGSKKAIGALLAADIVGKVKGDRVGDRTGGAGSYRRILIAGPGTVSHALAAWVAQDVLFFDPNYGEFWFENPSSFIQWFSKEFWPKSFYQSFLSDDYWVKHYAKRI